MNWNISAWSIRQPIPSILLFLILSISGVICYFNLGIDENPNIDMPTIMVTVSENGAAPSELETQVARRVEDAVAGIGNIKHITSTLNEGTAQTKIEFELGTNTDRALNDVRDAVTRIRSQLPAAIEEPTIQRLDFVGGPFATYTVSSKTQSVKDLSWLIDNEISRRLLAVKGVGQVQRAGGVDREINIDLDPAKLEALGVTADLVNTQVRIMNANMPGGRGSVGSQEQSIRTIGSATSVEQLKDTRVALQNGTWASLDSLGTVSDGIAEQRQLAMMDGKPAVAFSIIRSTGSNMAEVGTNVDKALEKMRAEMPDVEITKVRSNLGYVMESYHATIDSLLLGAALAIAVIWVFLRDWRASGIAALAMPLSMIPTFAVMSLLGFTLNNMSLLGLALVIGILVDDAIVEIENIVRHMQMGKKPLEAALEAADEIGLAVVATTMSIIVVFLPVAFMGGIPGQFFKQFGITVAVAVFFSLVVARLITPMMSAFWLKGAPEEPPKNAVQKFFDKLLAWALEHRGKTVLIAGAIFVASVGMLAALPTSLVNSADRGESLVAIELPPGATLETTSDISLRVTKLLMAHKEVEHVFASVGTPSTTGVRSSGSAGSINKANLYVILKERSHRKISQQQFEDMIRPEVAAIPGIRANISATMGLGGKVQILLVGPDAGQLKATTEKLAKEMRTVSGISDVTSSSALRRPEIQVIPDFEKASDHGISVQQIARTATMATVGDVDFNLAKFDLPDRQINIRVQIDPRYRRNIDSIGDLKVSNFRGQMVPLSEVAEVRFGSGPAQIDRYDRDRQVTISATLNSNMTLGQALKAIHQLPTFKNLPASIKENVSGDVEIQRDVFSGFGMAIAAAVVLIYAVLVLLFNDFLHPLTIMMSLPMAIGGAALGLIVAHQSVGLYALIGIVMLMGLVTKNAILLVEYVLMSMHRGVPRHEAILEATEARMRPILMTTVAMIAGMVPIALGIGAGSEVRSPMAVAVVGGLITSTFLTLIVVPVVFTYVDDWKLKIQNFRRPRNLESEKSSDKTETTETRKFASSGKH
ncbi:efflux RND transporter permease subunit [Candidatus Obscuribacterales bacterium]|nr:efflux RND transporter permease subunit [Candidatus Obscuribacterales bacterium]